MLKRLDGQVQADLDLLREGWTQESYRDGEGVCLVGSVMPRAMGQTCDGEEERGRSDRLSVLLGFEYSYEAIDWNDAGDRTVEQVYERIDNAINQRLTC